MCRLQGIGIGGTLHGGFVLIRHHAVSLGESLGQIERLIVSFHTCCNPHAFPTGYSKNRLLTLCRRLCTPIYCHDQGARYDTKPLSSSGADSKGNFAYPPKVLTLAALPSYCPSSSLATSTIPATRSRDHTGYMTVLRSTNKAPDIKAFVKIATGCRVALLEAQSAGLVGISYTMIDN